jgi:hypothetical protein
MMSGTVGAWNVVVAASGLGVLLGGFSGPAQAAETPATFEEAARTAAAAPELDALVAPYLDDCSKARREIDRARCRGMMSFVQGKLPGRSYSTVVDSPNVVSVSSYDAAIKGYRVRLVGCLTCEKPLAGPGGQKRFVTLKVPDKHAVSFGAASRLADSTVSFDSVPEARAWEAKVGPRLRAEFVFKPTAKEWSYRAHKGLAFVPVASRIFDRCTGEVLYSSPRSEGKVAVGEEVEGCEPEAPATASRSDKEQGPAPAGGGRDKEGVEGRPGPEKLGASEITQALKPVQASLRDCDTRFRTRGSVDLEFEVPGQGGAAQAVRAKGQLGGTEVAQCLLEAARKVRFPQFQRASQTFSFSVHLQGE